MGKIDKKEAGDFLLRIGAPAVLFAALALVLLVEMNGRLRARREEFRAERWKNYVGAVQRCLKQAGTADAARAAALAEWVREEDGVRGAFVWRKNAGLVCRAGISDETAKAFGPDRKWSVGERTGATARRAMEEEAGADGEALVWVRLLGRNEVAGVLVTAPDAAWRGDPVVVCALGACVVMLLALAGAWSYRQNARRAREESLRKTNFVSLVSHELKTPLAGIVPYAQMLRNGRLTRAEDLREAYEVIAGESMRLAALVDELLDLSRLETKRKRYVTETFDVADVAEEAARVMRARFGEGLLSCGGARGVRARADKAVTKGILLNLLDNAAKYAPGARVEVAWRAADGGHAVVEVADAGPGLTAAERARVFERFWRADDRTVSETGGFGLGLTIARRFARGMHGELTVAARPGGGTVFTLALPAGAV